MQKSSPPLSFTLDFDSPEFIENPYLFYHQLRSEAPVYRTQQGYWYLSKYDDVKLLMTNRDLVRDRAGYVSWMKVDDNEPSEFTRLVSKWMLYTDLPSHTCLRNAFNPFFTPDIIDDMQPAIQAIIDEQIDSIKNRDSFDLVHDFALPVALKTVCRLLDAPQEDYLKFKPWARAITTAFDNSRDAITSDYSSVVIEMRDYFSTLYSNKKKFNNNSVSSLWGSNDTSFDEDEFISHIISLMWAGHETTWMSISSGMLCLLQQPEQLNKLKDNPGLMDVAYEEILRLESPVQKTGRWTTQPFRFGNIEIPEGVYVVGLIGAANRDPQQFDNPDVIDLGRKRSGQMAFTFGIHNCLGAGLARLEGPLALRALMSHFPDMKLAEEKLQWRKFDGLRGLETLPVLVR